MSEVHVSCNACQFGIDLVRSEPGKPFRVLQLSWNEVEALIFERGREVMSDEAQGIASAIAGDYPEAEKKLRKWWISWNHRPGGLMLSWPWWFSGTNTLCAAIIAESEEAATEIVRLAYDTPADRLGVRFIEERPDDWSPWDRENPVLGRFAPDPWMLKVWPEHGTKKSQEENQS